MVIVPFVALSRIYYQCHWVGDTIIGGIIGVFIAYLGYLYFPIVATFMIPLVEYSTISAA